MRKYRFRKSPLVGLALRIAKFLLKSQLLTVFLVLFGLGFWVGARSRPDPGAVPYAELFGNLSVASCRDAPSDSNAHFVARLSACGKVFGEYEVDARRFRAPARGRAYSRAITGTHYGPLRVRGHVDQGFWLELPGGPGHALQPGQFDELYRKTLDYVKPVSIVSSVLGTLSGYSVGYRLATWNSSLCSRAVQERVLGTPGIGRAIAREAWRRVLLEPVVTGDEADASRFAAVHGTQRIYANFFKLALNDSDGFIPREAERLVQAGRSDESRAMLAFAEAVRRAAGDSMDLESADFSAVENWASLLDRRGHWAQGATPPPGEERMAYLGTLAWYGLAPPAPDARRIWVGPRVLVREGETEGFVADEMPLTGVACPAAWRPWLLQRDAGTESATLANAWIAGRPEFAPLVSFGRNVVQRLRSRR